jgi:hypothetical protein
MSKRGMAVVLLSAFLVTSWPQFAAGESRPIAAVAQSRSSASPAGVSSAAAGDAVLKWSENAGDAATAACIAPLDNPLHESRMYAMMHIAIHDALNAIDRRSKPYAYNAHAAASTSPDAAVAAAARTVLVTLIGQLPLELHSQACIDAGVASAKAAYTAALALIPNGSAKTDGITLGEDSARAILELRADDGAVGPFLNFNCPQDTDPGEFQCLPGTPFIPFEVWENVTPFVLKHSSQFRPGPPYRVASKKYAADFNEVKSLGWNGTTTPSRRSADQTEIALYWWESSPLKWNRVARLVSVDQGLDLWENARLFGLLNVALADGYIAMKSSKNHYNYWRPITAIREGDADLNPGTSGDSTWTPLRGTPPDQDYASGHSIEGGAGAEVLMQFFGTDRITFQDCSMTVPSGKCGAASPVLRTFSTFTQAADENALSRILIGFHFRKSVREGTAYGRKIGVRAVNHNFRLVH